MRALVRVRDGEKLESIDADIGAVSDIAPKVERLF